MANNNEQLIKVVEGRITRNSWLVNSRGKRISEKFVLYHSNEEGAFVTLNTSKGEYVYHKSTGSILLEKARSAKVIRITENLFGVKFYTRRNDKVEDFARIYSAEGKLLLSGLNSVGGMHNGLFSAMKSEKWGYMDKNLNFVIPPSWEEVSPFNENGYAVVYFKERKRIGVIDKKGSYVLSPVSYTNAIFETQDLLRVRDSEASYGIINVKGDVIVPVVYDNVTLKGNFFIVRSGCKYGLIDTSGNEIFECIYPEIIETDKKFVVPDFARLEIPKEKEVTK